MPNVRIPQVGTNMILSIVAACTAVVQIGMGVGSASSDYANLRAPSYLSASQSNLDTILSINPGGLDYFFVFGCSSQQRDTYWTVCDVIYGAVTVKIFS